MLEVTSRRFWNCFFLKELAPGYNWENMLLYKTPCLLCKDYSSQPPTQFRSYTYLHFFFCSVWQPKRAYLGKLVTKLCCIVRRAYRIILIVSSVSGSFNLFISSFSDPTFSKPHSTSSSVILFHCRIFLSICTSHIVVTESACSFVLTRIAKLPFLLEFSYILRFVDNCCKLNMERNIGHFVPQLKRHGLVCLAW